MIPRKLDTGTIERGLSRRGLVNRSALLQWLPWLHATWLVLLSPFLLFIQIDRAGWLLGIPAGWAATWVLCGRLFPPTRLQWPILVLGGMTLLSLFITPDMALSLPKAAGLFLGFAFFFVVVDLCATRRGTKIVAAGILAVGSLVALLGLLGTQWLAKSSLLAALTAHLPRVISGLPGASEGFHPNQVAGTLLWIVPLAWGMSVSAWRSRFFSRRWRFATGLAAVWVTGVLLVTQSRSAWLGITLALVAMLVVASRRARLAVAGLAIALAGLALVSQLSRESSGGGIEQVIGALNWEFRLEVWRAALMGISDFPFTGMGIGVFREAARLLYPIDVPYTYDFAHAHNEFLQATLDLGIPGLVAFVGLYVIAGRMLWALWRAPERRFRGPEQDVDSFDARPLALGIGGGLFAHMVYGLTDAVALGAKPGILMWLLLGLCAGLYVHTQASRREAPVESLA